MSTVYLKRKAASEYLREQHGIIRKPNTLAKLATTGGGPKFRKDGRFPVYSPAELDRWVEQQLSPLVASTSELPSKTTNREAA